MKLNNHTFLLQENFIETNTERLPHPLGQLASKLATSLGNDSGKESKSVSGLVRAEVKKMMENLNQTVCCEFSIKCLMLF